MKTPPLSFSTRWRIYFAERFPLLLHGVLVLVYVAGVMAYSARLHGHPSLPGILPVLLASLISFLLFLQLRILDEFKDAEDDARWRPYRPVPRGIISLRSLGWLGIYTALIQLGVIWWFMPDLLWILALIWLYAGLMGVEFFVRTWLKAHAAIYMATHMLIVPMITFFITAFDWNGDAVLDGRLVWLLAMSYCSFCILEIGRKIRAPSDEEEGVETYSALWGMRKAVMVWLVFMTLTSGFAVSVASQLGSTSVAVIFVLLLLTISLVTGIRFLKHPVAGQGKHIELLSGLAALGFFLVPGITPWLL